MISFIVPAHNEEVWIGRCLRAIGAAMEAHSGPHEIIVVDDASTDATPHIAREHGARVVPIERRQIAASRNAGAREAQGRILFFVDADTLVHPELIREALDQLEQGAIGGGCLPAFEGRIPLWWRAAFPFFALGVRWLRLPGGCFLFVERNAFEASGGFSEEYFAAEETVFATAMKRQGEFVVLSEYVVTSGRNLRAYSFWSIAAMLTRLVLRGPGGLRQREGLELWYQPRRETAAKFPSTEKQSS